MAAAWSGTVEYVIGDAVTHGGHTYVWSSAKNSLGVEPPAGSWVGPGWAPAVAGLPAPAAGDAGKVVTVKQAEDGYDLEAAQSGASVADLYFCACSGNGAIGPDALVPLAIDYQGVSEAYAIGSGLLVVPKAGIYQASLTMDVQVAAIGSADCGLIMDANNYDARVNETFVLTSDDVTFGSRAVTLSLAWDIPTDEGLIKVVTGLAGTGNSCSVTLFVQRLS